jgi:hypothetical protein
MNFGLCKGVVQHELLASVFKKAVACGKIIVMGGPWVSNKAI